MKILHVIVGLNVGGAETMLKRLIESKSELIPETIVVSLTSLGVIGEHLRARGVRIFALNMSSALDFPIVLWRLTRLIRRYQPTIVQTWMYHADLLGGAAARLAGCRCVVWNIRSTSIPQGALGATFWLVRLCALFSHLIPDRIICCANSGKAAHIKLRYAARKMTVIPNGYDFIALEQDLDSRLRVRRNLGVNDSDVVIGVVGRFDLLKDFQNFVTAASYVAARHDDIVFLMVGRGNDWSNTRLRGWIKDVDLEKRFRLVGQQSEIVGFLSAMDLFCLSSVSEAFPNVLVEAMAIGLPCVVTRAGDAADILGDDRFAVPVSDSASLGDALLRMCRIDQGGRKMLGNRNARMVRERYNIESVRQKYQQVYDDILSN